MKRWFHKEKELLPINVQKVVSRLENIDPDEVNIAEYECLRLEVQEWVEHIHSKMNHLVLVKYLENDSLITEAIKIYHNRLGRLENSIPEEQRREDFHMFVNTLSKEQPAVKQLWEFYELMAYDSNTPVSINCLWEIYVAMKVVHMYPKHTDYIAEKLYEIMRDIVKSNFCCTANAVRKLQNNEKIIFPDRVVDTAYETLDWYDKQPFAQEE